MGRSLLPFSLLTSGLLIVSVALGLGNSHPASAQESSLEKGVTATVESAVAAYNRGDLPALARLFTDEAFQQEFFESKSEAASDPEFFSDQVEVGGVRNITETETGAMATVDFVSGLGVSSEDLSFIFQGGIWVVSGSQPGAADVPEGTPVVDLALRDFAFVYDAADVASGNFALSVTNEGEQDHEVLLVQLPEAMSEADLVDTVASADENAPPPFLDFGFLGVFSPGSTRVAALSHPLEDGYYAFLCFLPDVDGTPHAFKGMVSTFTVGSPAADSGGGVISPPNTGDAGLAAPGSGVDAGLMALGVMVLVAGLLSGLRVVRR